jgi:SAM-dependent methyltransferase
MEAVYEMRGYDTDPRYSEFDPAYLQRVQSMECAYLEALHALGLRESLASLQMLDFGCGNGHWLARIASWGVPLDNLYGVDIRQASVVAARRLMPGCRIDQSNNGMVPYPDASFDVCLSNLVFTSILDENQRVQAAMELQRVTRPGGHIFVVDFRFNNPSNANVRRLTLRELRALFPGYDILVSRTLVLAPPLATLLSPRSKWLALALEAVPLLRTHFIAALHQASVESES